MHCKFSSLFFCSRSSRLESWRANKKESDEIYAPFRLVLMSLMPLHDKKTVPQEEQQVLSRHIGDLNGIMAEWFLYDPSP